MKRLGLLGGMSWESSIEYERWINEMVRDRLGGVASADLIIRSFNFADIEKLQQTQAWDEAGELLADAAWSLQQAGADALILCTNTMHTVADRIEVAVDIPLLHIADATTAAVHREGLRRVGVLGTRYTMEQDFYAGRLAAGGLDVIVPDEPDRTKIHEVIYQQLVRGIIDPVSKKAYLGAIDRLVERGAQGIIAACTEIELLVGPEDLPVPFFPTAKLHAQAAAQFALSPDE